MEIVWILLIGLAAGWLGGRLMKGGAYGLGGDLVLGLLGAVVGGYVFHMLGLVPSSLVGRLVSATIGAMLFIALVRFVRKRVR